VPEHLDRISDSLARDSSRRGFLARVGGALMAITAARTVGSLIEPGESDAFHFCGHTFTTGSCPHPTGLPRIDSAATRCGPATGVRSMTSAGPATRRASPWTTAASC
jgi:hypothetical protein